LAEWLGDVCLRTDRGGEQQRQGHVIDGLSPVPLGVSPRPRTTSPERSLRPAASRALPKLDPDDVFGRAVGMAEEEAKEAAHDSGRSSPEPPIL
jgi:hypothetical protein